MTPTSNYQKTELPGGLRVVTEKIPSVRSASLGIWVTVGSRHESASENGISHFIEHMAFKGTQTRSALDIARAVEQGGGYINAFTSKEITCFHVHVLDERLHDALEILTDILQHSLFDSSEMEKEKQVVLDEIRDHEDMPDDVAHEQFVRMLFEPHPLSRPILGPPDNVKSFSRAKVLKFVKEHYVPPRVVVAAAGHINHSRIVEEIEATLHFPKAGLAPKDKPVGKMTPKVERRQRPIQQAHMVIGTRGLAYKDMDRFSLSVMNTILGGGMSSRLFQNIREKHGVAYSIYSFAEMFSDTGIWGIYLATDADRVNKARDLVMKELQALRDTPLTADELAGVKMQLKGNIMLGLENVSSRMMRLGRLEIYLGRYHTLEDVSKQIDEVTPQRVRDLANALLVEDNLVTAVVEPGPSARKKAKKSAAE